MLNVGDIVPSKGTSGITYYIVIESGPQPAFELVEDFIARNYVIQDPETGDLYTLKQLINREKNKIISKGCANV